PDLGKPVGTPYGVWCLEALDSHGGWVSTAPDLVRFASAFNHPKSSKLLNGKSMEIMFACPPGAAGHDKSGKEKEVFYGCGWSIRRNANGSRNTWHMGRFSGTSTLLV